VNIVQISKELWGPPHMPRNKFVHKRSHENQIYRARYQRNVAAYYINPESDKRGARKLSAQPELRKYK
jgi:hypothetical protein